MHVDVSFLPRQVESRDLRGWLVVAIDVLRATTTVATALANGARAIRPVLEPEDARRERDDMPPGSCLLGGERKGLLIPGFDLGNSPSEYSADVVRGQTIILTTSNGTRLLAASHAAAEIALGAIVNAAAVARFIRRGARPTLLACAGRLGRFSLEDTLCAGQILAYLVAGDRLSGDPPARDKAPLEITPAAGTALALYRDAAPRLLEAVRQGPHGRYLASLGLAGDVEYCCQPDILSVVPRRATEEPKEWKV